MNLRECNGTENIFICINIHTWVKFFVFRLKPLTLLYITRDLAVVLNAYVRVVLMCRTCYSILIILLKLITIKMDSLWMGHLLAYVKAFCM